VALSSAAYQRAVAAIDAVSWRGIMPGLERTRALLSALGNPQRGLRGVLVAGTNGKGSVCALIDAVCRQAGLRTVLLTKPHLHSYCERIVRDGLAIPEDEFSDVVGAQVEAARGLPDELQPTGFEMLTAAGILVASRARADVVVCEVGLGGRLDSTNVLDLGVAVLTNVALDHQEYLGTTVAEIAREKAAIIKPGNDVVTAAQSPAYDVIRARAGAVGATVTHVDAEGRSRGRDGVDVTAQFAGARISVHSSLLGRFQVSNVATAVAACEALRRQGFTIAAPAVRGGCAEVRWPGRMQWIDGAPPAIVDGAHNPAAMAALVRSLPDVAAGRRVVAVFAAMRNKDIASMAARVNEATDDVIVTAPDVERAAPPQEVAACFAAATVSSTTTDALQLARRRAGADGLVLVCGSLYLAAEALQALGA